jgi:YDG domain/Bacterial Ig-like domain (group 3)
MSADRPSEAPPAPSVAVASSTSGTSIYGTAVTFTATVTVTSGGAPATSGNVQFYADGNAIGSAVAVNGSGVATSPSLSTLPVTGSPHAITANYLGATGFATSNGTLTGGQTITPLTLTVIGITANNKPYDGTTSATAQLNLGSASLSGVIAPDSVSLVTTNNVGTFDFANLSTATTITISGLALGGAQASDYQLPTTQATTPASITQVGSTVSVAWTDGPSATYNGSPHAAAASWTSTGVDGTTASRVVTYVGIAGTAYGPTTTAPTNSGSYEASAIFAGDVNHTGSSSSADFTINRVSPTSVETFIVPSVALQPSANLALDNDFTRFADAFADIRAGDTIQIAGTLDWSESHALASWQATGEAFAMPHLAGITLGAAAPGNGIHGPGDDPTISGEGPIYFDGLGADKGWDLTGLTISNFDTAIFFSPETDVTDYSGTHVIDNTINVPSNPGDPGANGGILLGPSPNQTIQGNQINLAGNGSAGTASFGITSFSSGGNEWNGLLIDSNIVNVTTPNAPASVLGIGENSGSVGSNLSVTNNTFNGNGGTSEVALGITSESVAATASNPAATVVYSGNTVNSATDGFVWGDPEASPA